MTYIAKLLDKSRSKNTIGVSIEFSDGINTHIEDFSFDDPDHFKEIVKSKLNKLEKQDLFYKDLIKGKIDLKDDLPIPDQKAEAQKIFLDKFYLYKRALEFVELGIILAEDPKIVSLKAELISLYKPEYINL